MIDDWVPPVGFDYTFNTVAFLMGGSIGAIGGDYSDIDVTLVEFDSIYENRLNGHELAIQNQRTDAGILPLDFPYNFIDLTRCRSYMEQEDKEKKIL